MQKHNPMIAVDQAFALTLEQMAWACGSEPAWIQWLVEEAVLAPAGDTPADWRFGADDLARARRAWRLQHELGANLEVLALMLDMLDEIGRLRARLRS